MSYIYVGVYVSNNEDGVSELYSLYYISTYNKLYMPIHCVNTVYIYVYSYSILFIRTTIIYFHKQYEIV